MAADLLLYLRIDQDCMALDRKQLVPCGATASYVLVKPNLSYTPVCEQHIKKDANGMPLPDIKPESAT